LSNAVSTEPQIPVGGVSASGQNLHGASAVAGGRRISADSFKLLTARLKANGSASAKQVLPVPAPPIPAIEVEALSNPLPFEPLPVQSDHFIPPDTAIEIAEEKKDAAPVSLDAEAVEAEFHEPELESELDPAPAPALALPEFNPLLWQEQAAEAPSYAVSHEELDERPIAGADLSQGVEEVELPAFQPVESLGAFTVEATLVVEAPQSEEIVFAQAVSEAEPENQAAEPEYQSAPLAIVDDAGSGDFEPIREPMVAESVAEVVETVVPALSRGEVPADSAAIGSSSGDAVAADEIFVPEAAVEAIDTLASVPELFQMVDESAVPASDELDGSISEVAAEQVEPQAEAAPFEAAPTPETVPAPSADAKLGTSEMAGRVVDAMLKTISTAIYAKPSSAERAAFVKEMASLMQEAASAADDADAQAIPAPAQDSPQPVEQFHAVPVPVKVESSVAEAIAERIGPSASPILKTGKAQDDPFASLAVSPRLATPRPAETTDADEESGELAMKLLDMMSGGTGSLPHERTLAADTLLRILPRIPVKQLLSVVERVAIMEAPPPLLVAKLIRDTRAEIVAPLLERCSHISDQDLMNAAPDGDAPKLRMIARRRTLSTVLSDYLIATEDAAVLLILIRNPGAALSHEAFFRLAELATQHHGLLAPLATRADLPPPVAFELFWHVPPELRRFIFSRFLTDSETLNKILRITLATHGEDNADPAGDFKFPPREAVETAIAQAAAFKIEDASLAFAEMAGVNRATVFRILSDVDGEPITVLLKALGCSRARFEESVTRLRLSEAGVLRADRNPEELQAIFDGLSFNKARILLTYWDWFVRKAGPYAPHN
jgi:uncharacterized protein (DUF2336 family)